MIRWIIFFLRLTVVDTALADPAEEGEGAGVGFEHHLLGLTRESADERHTAVAEPHMPDFDFRHHASEHHDLVGPVELIGLARREDQRHEGLTARLRSLLAPTLDVAPNRVIAAIVAFALEQLEYARGRQPLASRLARIGLQHRFQLLGVRPELG